MSNSSKKDLIILIHGFFKSAKDMRFLGNALNKVGYQTQALNLPTTFQTLETIYTVAQKQLQHNDWTAYAQVHFVGHSMGGLITRYYLSKHHIPNLGRCLCIGTPNKGSNLADIGLKIPFLSQLLKPIYALHSNALPIPLPLNRPLPEFGIIAGSNHWLSTGFLLKRPNDGRVEVEATKLDEALMKAFIVLYYDHKKIHHKQITADLVHQFLAFGRFEQEA